MLYTIRTLAVQNKSDATVFVYYYKRSTDLEQQIALGNIPGSKNFLIAPGSYSQDATQINSSRYIYVPLVYANIYIIKQDGDKFKLGATPVTVQLIENDFIRVVTNDSVTNSISKQLIGEYESVDAAREAAIKDVDSIMNFINMYRALGPQDAKDMNINKDIPKSSKVYEGSNLNNAKVATIINNAKNSSFYKGSTLNDYPPAPSG